MKTAKEYLDNYVVGGSVWNQVFGPQVIKAITEARKETSIEFGQFLNIDYTDKDANGKWLGEDTWRKMNSDETFTTAALYDLFIKINELK